VQPWQGRLIEPNRFEFSWKTVFFRVGSHAHFDFAEEL
jgi:hypothetical protein